MWPLPSYSEGWWLQEARIVCAFCLWFGLHHMSYMCLCTYVCVRSVCLCVLCCVCGRPVLTGVSEVLFFRTFTYVCTVCVCMCVCGGGGA